MRKTEILIAGALTMLFLLTACTPSEQSQTPSRSPDGIKGGQSTGTDCLCAAVYEPVCGTDGQTYPNACSAGCAQTPIAKQGEC